MNIKKLITAFACSAVGVASVNAFATEYYGEHTYGKHKEKVIGKYHVVTTETCVRTPYEMPPAAGFDAETRMLLVEGEAVSAIGSAQALFYPGGKVELKNGKQTETSTASTMPGAIPIVPASIFSCEGTYDLEGKTMAMDLMCTVEHPDPNISIALGPLNFAGEVSRDKNTISLANLERVIQTVTVSYAGNPVQQRQRICSQTASFTK